MDERERRWRRKIRDQGRKQVSFWLDQDTYQALQAYRLAHNLRGMGEAVSLLVGTRRAAQGQLQDTPVPDLNQPTVATPGPAQGCPQVTLMDRQPDINRCECCTTRGGRCRSKTTAVIKVWVGDQVAEFGSCKRHARDFEPYSAE